MLSSSPVEDRRVYFDGLMALQLELQKRALFNTNSATLQNLDNEGDSTTKLDEEEEVAPLPYNFIVFIIFIERF